LLKNEEVMKRTNGMSLEEIFIDSEYLQTVVIIFQTYLLPAGLMYSSQEKEFQGSYSRLAQQESVSVVLPGSARKLYQDAEGYVLYSVVVLKKFLPAIQAACRENRYTLRFFASSDLDKTVGEEDEETQIAQLDAEEKKIKVGNDGCV
jgi:hypothetical protein